MESSQNHNETSPSKEALALKDLFESIYRESDVSRKKELCIKFFSGLFKLLNDESPQIYTSDSDRALMLFDDLINNQDGSDDVYISIKSATAGCRIFAEHEDNNLYLFYPKPSTIKVGRFDVSDWEAGGKYWQNWMEHFKSERFLFIKNIS